MATGASNKKKPASEEELIAFLLAGYDSNRAKWDDGKAMEIANLRTTSLFLSPLMIQLKGRGKTIEKACSRHAPHLKMQRRPFNTTSRGEAVTLDGILHIDRVLTSIADHTNSDLKKTTTITRRGRKVCLVLEENDVIPSHLWVDRVRLTDFRDRFDISRKKLAELMFGNEDREVFFRKIEEGEQVEKEDKDKGLIKVTEYDFRVTPYSAESLYHLMETMFDALSSRLEDATYGLPAFEQMFQASSSAGLAPYKRTQALPIENGNITRPVDKAQKSAIAERVKIYAKRAPKQIKRAKKDVDRFVKG